MDPSNPVILPRGEPWMDALMEPACEPQTETQRGRVAVVSYPCLDIFSDKLAASQRFFGPARLDGGFFVVPWYWPARGSSLANRGRSFPRNDARSGPGIQGGRGVGRRNGLSRESDGRWQRLALVSSSQSAGPDGEVVIQVKIRASRLPFREQGAAAGDNAVYGHRRAGPGACAVPSCEGSVAFP